VPGAVGIVGEAVLRVSREIWTRQEIAMEGRECIRGGIARQRGTPARPQGIHVEGSAAGGDVLECESGNRERERDRENIQNELGGGRE
jgi:hypothetical protein